MDDFQLKRLWQNYIIHQPDDPIEKRKCLTKLLDMCIIYFAKQKATGTGGHDDPSEAKVSGGQVCQTAYNFIGKWLVPQFIIDLSSAYTTEKNHYDCDIDFLNNYFLTDIGGKLLTCIRYLNTKNAFLYDYELIKILVPILKQYILHIVSQVDEDYQIDTSQSKSVSRLDTFLEKYRFNEQVFLKSFKRDILSPVKVKSWIKDHSAHLHHQQQHQYRQRANQTKLSTSITSSFDTTIGNGRNNNCSSNLLDDNDDSDTEFVEQSIGGHIPRCRHKYQTLFCEHNYILSKVNNIDDEDDDGNGESNHNDTINDGDNSELFNYGISQQDEQQYLPRQSKFDIVNTIMDILFDFIRYESKLHVATVASSQPSTSNAAPQQQQQESTINFKLSTMAIVELSELFKEINNPQNTFNSQHRQVFQLACHLREFLVASCLTLARTGNGVKLIHRYKVFNLLAQLLGKIHASLEIADAPKEFVILLQQEYYDTYCLAIQLLTHIACSLRHTGEFGTMFTMMKEFFDEGEGKNGEEALILLITRWEKGQSSADSSSASRGEYESIYRLVDLLQLLQISLQRSHSLYLHRRICTKQRHNRCDLTPFMVHHFYHEKTFGLKGDQVEEQPKTVNINETCCPSMIYNVLINLIFIFSKEAKNNEAVDRLVCYICNHLCLLVSCCWSQKHYFKRLLYFAVNANRSNTMRNAIFNIIEFSIKTQRSSLFSTVFMLERCNYCMFEDLCDETSSSSNSPLLHHHRQQQQQPPHKHLDSNTSEGYLTDNGNSSLTNLSAANNIMPLDACSNANCLIKSLSVPYFNLLKSEDAAGRQAVFRHFYNLFAYLSTKSKLSLLNHVILPVFQNAANFKIDVSIFTLHLLVFIASDSMTGNTSKQPDGRDLNLLVLFHKIDGLAALRQLFLANRWEKSNEQPFTRADISFLALQLVGNFIRLELSSNKMTGSLDANNLQALTMLLSLLEEHFSLCTGRSSVLHNFASSLVTKPTNIESLIKMCRQKSLNLGELSAAEVNQLYSNLFLLYHLLNILYSILNQFESFRTILNHEQFRFSSKIYHFFQNVFKLALNEIQLYQLVVKEQQKHYNPHDDDVVNLSTRYNSFFAKILRIVEQLLAILLKLQPFYVDDQLCSTKVIASLIKAQLDEFNEEMMLVQTSNVAIDQQYSGGLPMLDLLGLLVNISFGDYVHIRTFTKNDDLCSSPIFVGGGINGAAEHLQHPRSTSFDSLMSDNDTTNDSNACTEVMMLAHEMDYGYEADTELNQSEVNELKAHDSSKGSLTGHSDDSKGGTSTTSTGAAKYVDICRVVLEHLIEAYQQRDELCRVQPEAKRQQQILPTQLNTILSVVNMIIKKCKDDSSNCRLLFEAGFGRFLLQGFRPLLDSKEFDKKVTKLAIFELFVEISRVQLRPAELDMFIDLFKMANADFEFLLAMLNKLLFTNKPNELARPRFSVKYPRPETRTANDVKAKGTSKNWMDVIMADIAYNSDINDNDLMSFKSMASIMPMEGQLPNRHYSLVFWVYLHRIQPLIERHQAKTIYDGGNNKDSNGRSEFDISATGFLKTSLIHIISTAFNSSTIELWYNYIYNRFVYRICKTNNGRVIYSSENFVTNNVSTLGRWNCLRINVDEVAVAKSRSYFVRIAHSINSSKDKILKLAFTPNIFPKSTDKVALLVGSRQPVPAATSANPQFHYRLGNVMLFREHLSATGTILLHSLGADFAHLHHLQTEAITNDNYFVLPKQLIKEYQVDIISSMLQCSTSSAESKWMLDNILLLYKASHPHLYFTYTTKRSKAAPFLATFSRLYAPVRFGNNRRAAAAPATPSAAHPHPNHVVTNPARMFCDLRPATNYGIVKTIADSGGVSVFIFMFCYLFEKSTSPAVHQKTMEMLLKIYDSHYFHRLMFDTQYKGYQLMLYTLEKSDRSFQPNLLKTFAQFSLDYIDCHSLVLSSNIATFIGSWQVWLRNPSTMRIFFSTLHSLVVNTNPYRNYNLEQLQKVNAFENLLLILKDVYVNLLDTDCPQLDTESIHQLVMILCQIYESNVDIALLKSLFQCLLLLYKSSGHLQVNQSRASCYYLFPSTSIVSFDCATSSGTSEPSSDKRCSDEQAVMVTNLSQMMKNIDLNAGDTGGGANLDDWEIVSEIVDASASVSTSISSAPTTNKDSTVQSPVNSNTVLKGTSNQQVIAELIMLINKLIGQGGVGLQNLVPIIDELNVLDLLLMFANNPAEKVREAAFGTFIMLYRMYYQTGSTGSNNNTTDATIKGRTSHLLLMSNQLYNHQATEEIVSLALKFLFNLDRKNSIDLLNMDTSLTFQGLVETVSLENFIPLLALLPKCHEPIGFSLRVLTTFRRIIEALSLQQIYQLQVDYGLVQSISKLVINFNTFTTITNDDRHKYTKEQINEVIGKILFTIGYNYVLMGGSDYFQQFMSLINYFLIMERKVAADIVFIFRQSQVSILQSAFEAVAKFQVIFNNNSRSSFSDYDFAANTYVLLNQSELLAMDLSRDSGSNQRPRDGLTETSKDVVLVQPKEMIERLKFIVRKSVNFVTCRDDIVLTPKEKYFQREVLCHLLDIVQCAENLQPKPYADRSHRSSKNPWLAQLQSSKDFFQVELGKILLYLISPFQKIDDRIFALHRFVEKSAHLEHVRQFLDKSNVNKFSRLFQAFVADLEENGVELLNIYDLQSYADEEYPTVFKEHFNCSLGQTTSTPSDSFSIKFVQTKFSQQLALGTTADNVDLKQEISEWYNQLQAEKKTFEQSILKHINKLFVNMTIVHKKVSEEANRLNDVVMVSQHQEEKEYFKHIRAQHDWQVEMKKKVLGLVNELLHERSVWHLPEHYPQTWTLSPVEATNRMRKRLERSFLELEPRYLRHPEGKQLQSKRLFNFLLECKSNPFSQKCNNIIVSSQSLCDVNRTTSLLEASLVYSATAKVVLFDEEIEGEILITEQHVRFVSNQASSSSNENTATTSRDYNLHSKKTFFHEFVIDFVEIQELNKCKYELQQNAMEIFLSTGLTYLLVFESTAVRNEFAKHLMGSTGKERLPNLIEGLNLVSLTQLWRERRISNFEYLTNLNKLSGRTSNDLMQYPVFPFVLADYQSDQLNLKLPESYRIMERPIAVQRKEREKHYVDQYNYIKLENERNQLRKALMNDSGGANGEGDGEDDEIETFQFVVTSAPYHYGAHYSNSGIVLHYLVRLPPYTQMFLHYQDNNFDIPDRTFHSMRTTWRLATEDSTNGFKELIPEFFYLPEFLRNSEEFNLGVRQNGEKVDNVILPPWCRNDARLFTLINRQALESNYVSQHLNHWIDLTFGFQQSGKPAVDAVNVFHPATHFSSDLSKIKDDVRRQAIKTMIKTFGQMPTQLFNMPHPGISSEAILPIEIDVDMMPNSIAMNEVIGLKWGTYVGSPIFGKPRLCFQKKLAKNFGRLWALPTNDILLLPSDACLLVTYNQQRNVFLNTLYIVSYFLVVHSKHDSTLWIRNNETYHLFTHENMLLDQICLCESIPDYDWILVGYESGMIVSFSLKSFQNTNRVEVKNRFAWIGHRSAITSISINKTYSVALTTDAGGTAILWDMNKQQYIRTIIKPISSTATNHAPEISLSTISDTLGDLALIEHSRESDRILASRLRVFTINGQPIGEVSTKRQHPYFTALCYSTATEGLAVNVIATGLSDGNVKLWSSWDLTLVREIRINAHVSIKSIVFSHLNDLLYITFEDNLLISLENSAGTYGSQSTSAYLATNNTSARKNFRLLDLT